MPLRRGGRVVECSGLENRRAATPFRGFESLPLRHHTPGTAIPSRILYVAPLDRVLVGYRTATLSIEALYLRRHGHLL